MKPAKFVLALILPALLFAQVASANSNSQLVNSIIEAKQKEVAQKQKELKHAKVGAGVKYTVAAGLGSLSALLGYSFYRSLKFSGLGELSGGFVMGGVSAGAGLVAVLTANSGRKQVKAATKELKAAEQNLEDFKALSNQVPSNETAR